MPAYRSAGGLDDNILVDGDPAFIGMELRKQPHQLEVGQVTMSRNGRIEGYWQPRKSVKLRSGALATSAYPLRLNFFVIDTAKVVSSAARASNVVTLTFGSNHNLTGSAYATLGDISVATNPLTGTNNVPPGAYLMTVASPTTLTFANTGADESLTPNATYGKVWAQIDDNAVSEIWGSCLYSNPSTIDDEYVILASTGVAKKVSLGDYTITDIPYPSGLSLSADVNMIQAFDRVYIFREGQQAWEYLPLGRPIESATYNSTNGNVVVTVTAHGLSTGDIVDISGITIATGSANPNGTAKSVTATTADTFTYVIASGLGATTYNPNTGTVNPKGFTKVLGGPYTQPQTFTVASNTSGFTVSNGLVSIPVVSNTTIKVGDFVTIYECDIPEFTAVVGKSFQVTSATATQIQFYAPIGNFSPGGSDQIEFGGRFSQGGGFIHQPGFPWAVYFQRRLWGPYWYSNGGSSTSPTYTTKNEHDQIVVSDILDGDTYDQIFSQFRITGGIADRVVGLHPFYEDRLIVFNRNSIHMVFGTQGTLEDTIVKELTREVGCLARRSIVSNANSIFFLSDNGVYSIDFPNDYNLRGAQEPLSKPIQPLIDRINKSLAENSVATYFNNRYWIAVPLDREDGVEATGNNTVLVYNVLNQAWESIDTYGTTDGSGGANLDIIDFHIGSGEARNNLYFVNSFGGVHEIDAENSTIDSLSIDVLGGSSSYKVDYELSTRGYLMGAQDRKKFSVAQVQCQSGSSASNVVFEFQTEDPDAGRYEVATVNSLIGQDLPSNEPANLRMRLGNPRGYYGILTISADLTGSAPVGRPKINSVAIDATITNRQTISQF